MDLAIRQLTERQPVGRYAPVAGVTARALIAVAAVIAIVVAGLGTGPAAQRALTPASGDRALVAAMQQIVFNPKNNTLYVLDSLGAAVDAREPETHQLKIRIPIGGEPSALALNEEANSILVLDASQKRVTEIDAASNMVVGATTVALAGTPTSISVDPASNKIIVTTEATPQGAAAQSPSGAVAIIDSATKQVETVRETAVAPRLVVPDPRQARTALVSADATTIVDPTFKVIETLPGGVSAAFSRRSDTVAVLSASGKDSLLTFAGPIAPPALRLEGAPLALTALPDGGYLVLVAKDGVGIVSRITHAGTVSGSTEVAVTGGDLVYDEGSNRFTVASAGRVDSAEMPAQAATGAAGAGAATAPIAATAPAASPAASSESQSPSASSAAPSTSPEVAAVKPSGAPVNPTSSPNANVLEQARLLAPNLYSLTLPSGIQPQIASARGSRLWFVDQSNGVHAYDMGTGDLFTIGKLRADVRLTSWVAGPSYVFGVDANTGTVHVVNAVKERIEGAYATNVLSPIAAAAVGLDDRLWIGLRNAPYLLAFDPKTRLIQALDLGVARVSTLTIDSQGRILYADDSRQTVGQIDPKTSLLNEVAFTRRGATTALLVDSTSTLWLGTSTGEVYSVRGGTAKLTVSVRRPVTALAQDHTGRAWYLSPLPTGLSGYAYGRADNSEAARSVAGPAVSLSFNPLGRAVLADPRGALWMSTEGAR